MNHTRILLICLAAVSLLLLSGCVTLLQEVIISEDGSGSLQFALGVETSVYPQYQEALPEEYKLENLLANLILDENVTNVRQDSYEAGGITWETIQMDVSNFARVFEEDRAFGPVTMSINQDDETFTFGQVLDLEESNMRIPGINLLDLTGAGYTVRLITPQIITTNGLQEAAGISVWDVSLSELMQGGETIYLFADYVFEPYEGVFIPWETFFPYVVIGFLALGGIAILLVIIVNTAGSREKERKIRF